MVPAMCMLARYPGAVTPGIQGVDNDLSRSGADAAIANPKDERYVCRCARSASTGLEPLAFFRGVLVEVGGVQRRDGLGDIRRVGPRFFEFSGCKPTVDDPGDLLP